MPNNPFSYSDEMGFEQSAAVSKPKSAVADAAKSGAKAVSQQVKAAAQDATNQFLDALYGSSTPSSDQQSDTPTQQSQPLPQQGTQHTRQHNPGAAKQPQSPEEQAKQAEGQKSTDAQKRYYETDIEQGIVKARREREDAERQRAQAEAEEAERLAQEKEEQEAQFIAPTGKATGAPGRNRKGQRPLSVIQSQNKGETGRNVVAG